MVEIRTIIERRYYNSRILHFSWLWNVFKVGRKRDLDENDLYAVYDDHKSSLLGNELER